MIVLQFLAMLAEILVTGALLGVAFAFGEWVFGRLSARGNSAPEPADEAWLTLANGTRVRMSEVPRMTDGAVDPAWLDEHCDCGKRHSRSTVPTTSLAGGMYL